VGLSCSVRAGSNYLRLRAREKTIITKICDAGDVLSLNATVSGRAYEVTAEMKEPGQASFIGRAALLEFFREYKEVALRVAEQLSSNYYAAHEEIRTLGLSRSPAERFARLLLSWSANKASGDQVAKLSMTMTHQEIAEMIGTTRETVSRLFSDFKKKRLLEVKWATLTLRDRPALSKMIKY
jgi:CRP/FNR family cyclic AMP-dependent transcriptional regulator